MFLKRCLYLESAFVACALFSLFLAGCPMITDVVVPNVVGLRQQAASEMLVSAGLTVGTVSEQHSLTMPADQVISQEPGGGATVSRETAVDLVVSLGPVLVPNVTGMTQAEAESALSANDLTVGTVSQRNSDTVAEGNVISQYPTAGSAVAPQTNVSLVISLGRYVDVPDIVGMTRSDAEQAVTDADLTLGIVSESFSQEVAAGNVISQLPAGGTRVSAGTSVSIVVSKGRAPALLFSNVNEQYTVPYLLDFTFSLRDQDDHAVLLAPPYQVSAWEDGDEISPSETGLFLVPADLKEFKSFLVLDYTNSMSNLESNGDRDRNGVSDAIDAMEENAKDFLDWLRGRSEDSQVGIYEFHREDVDPGVDGLVSGFTTNLDLLEETIDRIRPDFVGDFPASTRCWDALYAAVERFGIDTNLDERRFIVFSSDAADESSYYTYQDVIDAANSRNIHIYAIGYGAERRADIMMDVADSTGGQYYDADSVGGLYAQFEQILRDLGGQYTLRWSTLRRRGSFEPRFEVTRNGLTASYTAEEYVVSGSQDVLRGVLRVPEYEVEQENGTARVYLRAAYMPRYVRQFAIYVETPYEFTVTNPADDLGGLCGDWPEPVVTAAVEENGWWVELASPDPDDIYTAIPFAAFGIVLRFDFVNLPAGVTEPLFQDIFVDNTVYAETGGQWFVVNGAR